MKMIWRSPARLALFLILWVGLAIAPLSAQSDREKDRPVYLGLLGGFGHSESQGGVAEIKAEALLSLTPSLSLGLGFGYLNASDQRHGMGYSGMGGMWGGMMGAQANISMGIDHNFRSTPLTLTAYLRRPVGRTAGVSLHGGVGYYWARYRDIRTQRKSAFGPHLGLGADLRLARHVLVVGEAGYRFVRFRGFQVDAHPGFDRDAEGHPMAGFWYFNQADSHYHFRVDDGHMYEFMRNLPSFDIALDGFSLRAGLRFGF